MNGLRAAGVVVALAVAGGCGTATDSTSGEPVPSESVGSPSAAVSPTALPASTGEVTTTSPVTVLDDGEGAQLCLGAVMTSLPPQCGGPRLLGWDWGEHEGHFEDRSGTRWGAFVVTGVFDGADLEPTDVVAIADWEDPGGEDDAAFRDFTSPCPEPAGGWRPVDPATTTEQTERQAIRVARALPTFGESWVDQSINPAAGEAIGPEEELLMNDPRLLVLNVRVTDDVAGAEAAIREVWGGALCVSEARHTDRELARIQRSLTDLPGMTYSSRGDDRVDLGVIHDDGSVQAWADREFGDGVVAVDSALRPVG